MDNNIDQVIREKNITQGELAQALGVNHEYITRIINQEIIPTVLLGVRIANALEVPLEDLFAIELSNSIHDKLEIL